jgi:hypothetical protein
MEVLKHKARPAVVTTITTLWKARPAGAPIDLLEWRANCALPSGRRAVNTTVHVAQHYTVHVAYNTQHNFSEYD